MTQWTDVMVDIETTGTQPDRTGILQIAAVKFNLETREVKVDDMFDRCLTLPAHRFWDQSTAAWWGRQKKSTLDTILSRAEPWQEVTKAFAEWGYAEGTQMRFWSKPTTFDFMFLASYFADMDLHNPFHYRAANDLNSFLRGMYHPAPVPELDVPFTGAVHNALADTLWQLKMLFAHLDKKEIVDVAAE